VPPRQVRMTIATTTITAMPLRLSLCLHLPIRRTPHTNYGMKCDLDSVARKIIERFRVRDIISHPDWTCYVIHERIELFLTERKSYYFKIGRLSPPVFIGIFFLSETLLSLIALTYRDRRLIAVPAITLIIAILGYTIKDGWRLAMLKRLMICEGWVSEPSRR